MHTLSRIGVVALVMFGALTACMGDGNSTDSNGEVQGVPGTVAPMEVETSTATP